MQLLQAKLIEWREIAPGVRNFVFETLDVPSLDFTPGQFISFTNPVNGQMITRAYSIASAPNGGPRFDLCLNLVEGGMFTPHLFALEPGAVLTMKPPLGIFTLPIPRRDALLIATGTGIAPYRAVLQAHLTPDSHAFTLLFGVRYDTHLLYREELEETARRFPNFRFIPTVTQPGPEWTGRRGRVQAHLDEALGGRRDLDIMLCGLRPMVDDMRRILKEMGFDRKQIRFERYD